MYPILFPFLQQTEIKFTQHQGNPNSRKQALWKGNSNISNRSQQNANLVNAIVMMVYLQIKIMLTISCAVSVPAEGNQHDIFDTCLIPRIIAGTKGHSISSMHPGIHTSHFSSICGSFRSKSFIHFKTQAEK